MSDQVATILLFCLVPVSSLAVPHPSWNETEQGFALLNNRRLSWMLLDFFVLVLSARSSHCPVTVHTARTLKFFAPRQFLSQVNGDDR
jgi:hypothetical protein